jgi:three-Cys-motif partner protein
MNIEKNKWDISNRPSTKTKLNLLDKCFNVWLTVWNNQPWVAKEWYIIDLFAGRGFYTDRNELVYGSPLIFLKDISEKIGKFKQNLKIKLFFVEKAKNNFKNLKKVINEYIEEHPDLENIVEIFYYNNDCNEVIKEITSKVKNNVKHPIFALIDPWGIQIKKSTAEELLNLKNPKDIMFNYILEGVRRAGGVARKASFSNELDIRELRTTETFWNFIGENTNIINSSDKKILEEYVNSLFVAQDLNNVVGFDVKYPDRDDILYFLLYACRNERVIKIIKDIFAKEKENIFGKTLFGGKDYYKNNIITIKSKIRKINRKTLLYKTGVEYGNWTINHVQGCMHGCKFPCYAFMMSKKFGRVKNYDDWRKPKIVSNALELLEKEVPKYRKNIDYVHLSFMTDPFMYDFEEKRLIPEIKELTLGIIEMLNRENIRVTTLTKAFYPEEIFNAKFLKRNEYGITIVSLSNEFKEEFEPFSASYNERISSLKKLHDAGLNTWASIEPYPTPNLDSTAENIENLLERISFVNKIIFGKMNYNVKSTKFSDNENFYKRIAKKVVNFCDKNKIIYHIKFGTPYSKMETKNIFNQA